MNGADVGCLRDMLGGVKRIEKRIEFRAFKKLELGLLMLHVLGPSSEESNDIMTLRVVQRCVDRRPHIKCTKYVR